MKKLGGGVLLACLFSWMSGCVPAQWKRETLRARQERAKLRRELAELKTMVRQLSNQSSNAVLRMKLHKLQRKVRTLQQERDAKFFFRRTVPFRQGSRRTSPVRRKRERVSAFVRSMMPLASWLQKLPVQSSPPLRSCRQKLQKSIAAHVGARRIQCTAAAGSAKYTRDCSGLVRCIYSRLNLDLFKPSSYRGFIGPIAMFHYFHEQGWVHRGAPRVGDAVFWHGTIDRDRDGRYDNDPITHVGIVAGLDPDGRIRILHTGFGRRKDAHIVYMYLKEPSLYRKRRRLLSKRPARSLLRGGLCSRNRRRCRLARRLFRACKALQRRATLKSQRRYFKKRCSWRKKRVRKLCPTRTSQSRRRSGSKARRKRRRARVYNSFLVSKRTKKVATGYTTGELFAGFGTLRWCELVSN